MCKQCLYINAYNQLKRSPKNIINSLLLIKVIKNKAIFLLKTLAINLFNKADNIIAISLFKQHYKTL